MWCSTQITSSLGANFLSGINMFDIPKKPLSATKLRLSTPITRFQKFSLSNKLTAVAKNLNNWSSKTPKDLQEDIMQSL
jgi:hypothetical protein